jgi:hypothetical protein
MALFTAMVVVSIGNATETCEIKSGWIDLQDALSAINQYNKHLLNIVGSAKRHVYAHICGDCKLPFVGKLNTSDACETCRNPKHHDGRVVYLVRSEMTGLYKIGFSGNLRKRLRQIETASGSKVQLISSVAGDEKL